MRLSKLSPISDSLAFAKRLRRTSEYQAHQRLFGPNNPRTPCMPGLDTCMPVLKTSESQVSNISIEYHSELTNIT
mgnify:CR=1 FL=1